jgi:hypothetical protein
MYSKAFQLSDKSVFLALDVMKNLLLQYDSEELFTSTTGSESGSASQEAEWQVRISDIMDV